MIIGLLGFFLSHRLKRLQSDDKEEVISSAHKGTHILGGGDRKSRNFHYSSSTYPVPSAKFGVSLAINTYCTMHWALRMSCSQGEAFKNNSNDNTCAIREYLF